MRDHVSLIAKVLRDAFIAVDPFVWQTAVTLVGFKGLDDIIVQVLALLLW